MKHQITKLMSPKGTLKFPHLVTPSEKFGNFETGLVMTPEEAQPFMEKIEAIVDQGFATFVKENPAKAKRARKVLPFSEEIDKEGNETGNIEFKFRVKAVTETKSGKTWNNKVTLLDSKGKLVKGVDPWGGTVAKVGIEMGDPRFPYSNPAGVGVTIRLRLVQIIELRTAGMDFDATAGFDIKKEDGFEVEVIPEDDDFEGEEDGFPEDDDF